MMEPEALKQLGLMLARAMVLGMEQMCFPGEAEVETGFNENWGDFPESQVRSGEETQIQPAAEVGPDMFEALLPAAEERAPVRWAEPFQTERTAAERAGWPKTAAGLRPGRSMEEISGFFERDARRYEIEFER